MALTVSPSRALMIAPAALEAPDAAEIPTSPEAPWSSDVSAYSQTGGVVSGISCRSVGSSGRRASGRQVFLADAANGCRFTSATAAPTPKRYSCDPQLAAPDNVTVCRFPRCAAPAREGSNGSAPSRSPSPA